MSAASNALHKPGNEAAILRLTALWGLAESGLGGVLFALKIPLTGFIIGAVAVVLLNLLARFSQYSARQILRATVVVLLVKAAVSPHSPPAAYLAVLFQGVLAALLFSVLRNYRIAPILLGMLSMAECALQKIITLTLLFGKSIWEAIDNLGKEIAKNFSVTADHHYVLWVIGGYTGLYALWGIAVGVFASRLPARMEAQHERILKEISALPPVLFKARKRKAQRWIFYGATLLFILAVFAFSGAGKAHLTAILLRSGAAMILLLLLQPLLQNALRRWLRNRSGDCKRRSEEVLQLLPALRSFLPATYARAQKETGFLGKIRSFMLTMIVLSLYAEPQISHPDSERPGSLREDDGAV